MQSISLDSLPPMESLIAVIVVARAGSLTRAAAELGVTHAAAGRRVAGVETWLGITLFERHGRGMRLTPDGVQFVRRTERALGSIAALAGEIRAERETTAVRISVLPAVARLWLLPRLAVLQGEPADLTLHVLADQRLADLGRREADIAIRFGLGDWPDVQAIPLMEETVFPVASPAVARRLAGRPVEALAGEVLLHDSDGADWAAWLQAAGVTRPANAGERRFVDHDLALQAASLGHGVALARLPVSAPYLDDRRLVRLAGPTLAQERRHHLVMRQSESRTAVLRLAERLKAAALG